MNDGEFELLEKYVDNILSDEEALRLQELLLESSEARATLRSLATIEFGVQDYASRSSFESDDELILPKPLSGESHSKISAGAANIGPVPTGRLQPDRPLRIGPAVSPWMWVLASAATIALAVGSYVLWSTDSNNGPAAIASIARLSGSIIWTGDGGRVTRELATGQRLSGGTIEGTTPNSWVELEFNDGSTFMISGDSRITFSDFNQKRLHLSKGRLSANVSPQLPGNPMLVNTPSAQLEILGTQFDVETQIDSTALTVNEGKVRAKRLSDGETVDVPAQHRVIAQSKVTFAPVAIPDTVNNWNSQLELGPKATFGKWSPATGTIDAGIGLIPFLYEPPNGQTIAIYSSGLEISNGSGAPVVLKPNSVLRVRGHIHSKTNLSVGLTVRHPNGGFGGNFMAIVPSTELVGNQLDLTFGVNELLLAEDLKEMKHELVGKPTGVVVEAFWCASLEEPDGLIINEVEIITPIQSDND